MQTKQIVAILGPTACGKTSLALELSELYDCQILNCDSRQIFSEMEIGTAKPSSTERKRIPHHLLDICPPSSEFSAGDYCDAARKCLDSLWNDGKRVILAGGTGFYFEALVNGLSDTGKDPILRQELTARLDDEGLDALVAELYRLDPQAAGRIDLKNPRRVIRALEIIYTTGLNLSDARRIKNTLNADLLTILVTLPRKILHEKITERVKKMIHDGLQTEVQTLVKHFGFDSPGLKTIGYAEWKSFFDGTTDLESVIEQIIIHTRQYAKRQETWFRKRPGIPFIDLSLPDAKIAIKCKVEQFYSK